MSAAPAARGMRSVLNHLVSATLALFALLLMLNFSRRSVLQGGIVLLLVALFWVGGIGLVGLALQRVFGRLVEKAKPPPIGAVDS